MQETLQLTVSGAALGCVYALVAVGFVLIYKATGHINFAQGDVMALGAFLVYLFGVGAFGLPFWAAVLLALLSAALFMVLVERLLVRRLARFSHEAVLVGTLGLGILIRAVLAAAFGTDEDGVRWFRTDDVGHTDERARLHVDGRVDDLVTTGGLKVAPRLVEEAVVAHVPGVREVVVVGTPHAEWGQAVSVLAVLEPDAVRRGLTAADLRAHLRGILPDHALPVRAATAETVPLAGPGKPDRRAVAALLTVG